METSKRIIPTGALWIGICLLTLLFSVADLQAAAIATLRNLTGQVDILASGKLPAVAATNGAQLSSGDLIRTKSGASAEVVYLDGTLLRVGQRSRIDIGEHFSGGSPSSSEVRLVRGTVQAVVDLSRITTAAPGAKRFQIRTPNAIAGVRGTDYTVAYEKDQTNVLVTSGEVFVYNLVKDGQIVNLTPGSLTTVIGPNRPTPPRPALEHDKRKMRISSKTGDQDGSDSTTATASELVGEITDSVSSEGLPRQLSQPAGQVISNTVPPLPPPPPPPPAEPMYPHYYP
jgi:hypothetical protein